MGERLYILDDVVAECFDASGQPSDRLMDEYPDIAEVLTSDELVAVIDVHDGEVKLLVADDSEDDPRAMDPIMDTDTPGERLPGFTGYVRYGLFEEESELLRQVRG